MCHESNLKYLISLKLFYYAFNNINCDSVTEKNLQLIINNSLKYYIKTENSTTSLIQLRHVSNKFGNCYSVFFHQSRLYIFSENHGYENICF
jgi:hypothetical protein